MTLEEAVALVLEESMRTEPVPENAMAVILHLGIEPSDQHIAPLIEALRVIQEGLKEQPLLDRNLAAALWILGVEASGRLDMNSDKIVDLMMAVESIFFDDWFVQDRKRGGGNN